MSQGVYGTTIPVQINSGDISKMVDVYYSYSSSYNYDDISTMNFKRLEDSLFTPAKREITDANNETDDVVEGLYTLNLPSQRFAQKGYYTIYIKPKEIPAVISDVGTLTAYPDVRGLVIDSNNISVDLKDKLLTSNELVGYRVIYLSDDGARLPYYRIITSNNKCEPIVQAPNSSSDKSYTYRFNDSSNLAFVTVTPSSGPNFKSNITPYIGKATQRVLIVNTMFEPIQINLERTQHDADTISSMLENSQLRDLDNGIVTTFNDNNEIYHQAEHFTLKDQYTGKPVYEV